MPSQLTFENEFATLEVVKKNIDGEVRDAPVIIFTDAGEQKLIEACRSYRNSEMWEGRDWVFVRPSRQKIIFATRQYLLAIVGEVLFGHKPKIDIWDVQDKLDHEIDPSVYEMVGIMDLFSQMADAIENDGQ